MKKYIVLLFVVLFSVSFWNCEKDDLCADGTATTPRLVIEFYDETVTDSIITIPNIGFFETSVNDTIEESNVSQILVPLKTNEDSVTFALVLYGDTTTTTDDLTDYITINYTRQDIYISRACGYKTNFTISDVALNSTNWISTDTIAQNSITNENEVHIKLYR